MLYRVPQLEEAPEQGTQPQTTKGWTVTEEVFPTPSHTISCNSPDGICSRSLSAI